MLCEYMRVSGSYVVRLWASSRFLDFMYVDVYTPDSVATGGGISSLFLYDDSLVVS